MIGITQGIALACGQVCDMGQPQIAKDILKDAGMLSKRELIKNEVDDMDIEKLAGILEA
jgi:translation elongation factor EF-4